MIEKKLLLDEMYAGLKEYFETLGYSVKTAQEAGLTGLRDIDIVNFARNNDLILITRDQKPAELAQLTETKFLLISNLMIAKIADKYLKEKFLL